MTEEMKQRVAVFRFGVIADFVDGRQRQWGEVERLMREKCARRWLIPGSIRTRISESTIKDWIHRYKNSGNNLESLHPRDRCDCGKTRCDRAGDSDWPDFTEEGDADSKAAGVDESGTTTKDHNAWDDSNLFQPVPAAAGRRTSAEDFRRPTGSAQVRG